MPKKNPCRNVLFTLFNFTEESLDGLKNWARVQYCIAGKEVCPTTNREHLQGYIQFNKEVAFTSIQSIIPSAHLEIARGSPEDNVAYCSKEGNLFCEFGCQKSQGRRTDIHAAIEMIDKGHSMKEVAKENPLFYIRYHRGFEKYKSLMIEPRSEAPDVLVLFGSTGTGKSRSARECLPNAYVWGPEQGKWFDGYEGQSEVIFEEFRGQLPFGMLLRLLDRYDCRVETKGSTIQFVATKIVITSPVHPTSWYSMFENSEDKIDQLLRRINEVKDLNS